MSPARVLRSLWVAWVALVAAVGSGPAAAHEGPHRAGLVVRHGDGRLTYAYVVFPEEELRGIELLRRSGLPLVTVGFGGLGEAVCALEGEGCSVGECRKNLCQSAPDAPYWQPCSQAAPGEWRVWRLGASAAKIGDGEVYGWAWGSCEELLPVASIADIARLVGVPDPPAPGAADVAASSSVKTVHPAGVAPERGSGQGTGTYVAAAAIIALIGAGALYSTRRGRGAESRG